MPTAEAMESLDGTALAAQLREDMESGTYNPDDGSTSEESATQEEAATEPEASEQEASPDGGQQVPAHQPPAEQPPAYFQPVEWNGRELTPEAMMKDPAVWRDFISDYRTRAEGQFWRQQDYTAKTQELAGAQRQYQEFFEALTNPETGKALVAELCRRYGYQVPQDWFNQIQHDPVSMVRSELEQYKAEQAQLRQQAEEQALTYQELHRVQQEWDTAKQQFPHLDDDDWNFWSSLQRSSANMTGPAAAEYIAKHKAGWLTPERWDKYPEATRNAIERHIQKSYLAKKTKQQNAGGLAAVGGGATPATSVGRPASPEFKGDLDDYNAKVIAELRGKRTL